MIRLNYSLIALLVLPLCGCSSGSSSGGVAIGSTSPAGIQGNKTNVPWSVTGSGFQAGATVTMPYTGVTISNVNVVSATSITFTVTSDNTVPTGTATLTVTNPDNTAATSSIAAVTANVTLAAMVQPIFSQGCAVTACHTGGAPPAGLDLSSGSSFAALVGVASTQVPSISRAAAGNAESSYLVDKLEGTQTVGGMMPAAGAPLSTTQILMIRAWIDAGALNN